MPQIVQGGKSVFSMMPDEQRTALEAQFGSTADEQLQLLTDFVYELGRRGYTAIQPREAAPPPVEGQEGDVEFDFEGGGEEQKKEEPEFDF